MVFGRSPLAVRRWMQYKQRAATEGGVGVRVRPRRAFRDRAFREDLSSFLCAVASLDPSFLQTGTA